MEHNDYKGNPKFFVEYIQMIMGVTMSAIKIYSSNDGYNFSIGKDHYSYYYAYAIDALKAATSLRKSNNPLKVLASTAEGETYDSEDKVFEISADDMISQHYSKMYEGIAGRVKGLDKKDTDERKMSYEEIKSVVKAILTIQDKLKDKKQKKEIDNVLSKFRKLTKKNFMDLLSEDVKKQKEESQAALPTEDASAEMPQTPKPEVSKSLNSVNQPNQPN